VKRSNLMVKNISGFTLVELIVTMAVFLVVIVIASQTFDTILSNSARYSKSEESNIEGIIGLEVLRHDLEQMGFGLPWQFQSGSSITYEESVDAKGKELNDASDVPRAFVGRDGFGEYGSDFIAIKASTVGDSKSSPLWTYIPFENFSTATGRVSRPVAWPSQNLKAGDMVISVRSNFNNELDDHILAQDSSNEFSFAYDTTGGIDNAFLPQTDQETQMVYGITDGDKPRMPFNRADYFVNYSSIGSTRPPSFCAEKTGVLYKAVVSHDDGTYTSMPLLDCVADMQVVLGWDTSNKGLANTVNAYSSMPAADGSVTATPASAASIIKTWLTGGVPGELPAQIPRNIREHLKVIKVYILAQEGRRDRNYTYPTSTIIVGKDCTNSAGESSDIDCGSDYTRQYTLSAEQRHFRWKLYRIIVRPKTLVSNQR
jgi:prepilin-type N-terminal cleavage/methylation domain-containing protein